MVFLKFFLEDSIMKITNKTQKLCRKNSNWKIVYFKTKLQIAFLPLDYTIRGNVSFSVGLQGIFEATLTFLDGVSYTATLTAASPLPLLLASLLVAGSPAGPAAPLAATWRGRSWRRGQQTLK